MQEDQNTEEYIVVEDLEETKKEGWRGKFDNFINGPYFVAVSLILIAITAFALGRISGLQEKRESVRVLNNSNNSGTSMPDSAESPSPLYIKGGVEANISNGEVKGVSTSSSGAVVASKSGTKYHYPWCAGAKQISAKNLITFNSIEEARAKGYTPASNCKGLK